MGLENIDLYVGSEIFIEIDRMSGRFAYKNENEPSETITEDIEMMGESSSPIEGDCQSISKEEVRKLLNDQSSRYERVIEVIEETRKF